MRIQWFGHACFTIEAGGVTLLTDPFDKTVPYAFPSVPIDIATVSHGHFDHNAVHRVAGEYATIQATGTFEVRGVPIRGIASFHDAKQGEERGDNIAYTYVLEGITLAHLGDLGAPLTSEQRDALSDVEILLIPVGGTYTLDAAQAADLCGQLPKLRIVLPMHYKTDVIADWPIAGVEEFAALMDNIRRIGASTIEVCRDSLPERREVWILDHA